MMLLEGWFPWWLRSAHLINFFLIGLLLRSGWEILASHPRLYWRDQCGRGQEWLRFTKDKVPEEIGAFTARDDQREWSPVLCLPGKGVVGLGRAWHALGTCLWVLNGFVYVVLLLATGLWRRIVPTSWSIIPEAWHSLLTYLSFHLPPEDAFVPYDSLQKLMYGLIVFVWAPLMMLTGPVMSPAVIGRHPWYAKLFGGRQAARSIHFLGMAFICVFVVIHVTLVFVVYAPDNLTHIVYGHADPARYHSALAIVLVTIALVVASWLAMSYWSLADKRRAQKIVWGITNPARRLIIDPMHSRQVRTHRWSEKDISPFHWVNTRTPDAMQSPEYAALAANDFKDFRLEVGGLVAEPRSFSLTQLADDFDVQNNITMHTCMQGWTGIAKWTGVRLRDVLASVDPLPGAEWVMIESFGYASKMHDGRPVEPYYTCLPRDIAMEDETILAWAMNDQPLHPMFGPPLRLRVESMHGYKMVKWVRSVSWIHDYKEVGDGQGGTREDSGYQHIDARI